MSADSKTTRPTRRSFMETSGVALTGLYAGITGCTSDGEDGDDDVGGDPPQQEIELVVQWVMRQCDGLDI